MALVLTGSINGMRPVSGTSTNGDAWQFLSLEIVDSRYGHVYSCQLRDNDPQFSDFVEHGKLKQDWSGHKVKVVIRGQSAQEREIEDKKTGETRTVMQIRSYVTNLRDLGLPSDED